MPDWLTTPTIAVPNDSTFVTAGADDNANIVLPGTYKKGRYNKRRDMKDGSGETKHSSSYLHCIREQYKRRSNRVVRDVMAGTEDHQIDSLPAPYWTQKQNGTGRHTDSLMHSLPCSLS